MKFSISLVLLLFSLSVYSASQEVPPRNLSGVELRHWLKQKWYQGKHKALGYSQARRFMYSAIDKDSDGNVTGVYTGITQAGRNTSFLDPINAEHTIPQSWFGKKKPMKSDIHHLFPTHKKANSSRGSLPFGEIDDNVTDKWYGKRNNTLQILRNIPTQNRDSYSEVKTNKRFEPAENHKGNIARAIFYFYTMYPDAAGNISKIAKTEELFLWHQNDPVDATERRRNDRIEARQGNRNPYIDDPQLASRAWGNNRSDVVTESEDELTIRELKAKIVATKALLEKLTAQLNRLENN